MSKVSKHINQWISEYSCSITFGVLNKFKWWQCNTNTVSNQWLFLMHLVCSSLSWRFISSPSSFKILGCRSICLNRVPTMQHSTFLLMFDKPGIKMSSPHFLLAASIRWPLNGNTTLIFSPHQRFILFSN